MHSFLNWYCYQSLSLGRWCNGSMIVSKTNDVGSTPARPVTIPYGEINMEEGF